jgi:hypothetical protein
MTQALLRRGAQLMWGKMLQGWNDWRFVGTLLDQFLVKFNKTAPGNIKAVNFLKAKYPTVQALNTAWYARTTYVAPALLRSALIARTDIRSRDRNTSYTSFSSINTRPSVETSAYTNDSAAFTYMAAVQFFNVSRNCTRDSFSLLSHTLPVVAVTDCRSHGGGDH